MTITQEDVKKEIDELRKNIDEYKKKFGDQELPPRVQEVQAMLDGGQAGIEKLVDQLVTREVLYLEAKKQFENTPEFKKNLEDYKKMTLIGLYLDKEGKKIEEKTTVSDKDLRDFYEKHKSEMGGGSQIRASHILVKTEGEAKNILEQIRKGADFAKLAKEKSIDKGSAAKGGDIGFFSKGQLVPEFDRAASNLKEGEVGGPVKTRFGYHIIKVTGRKEGQVADFEKVKDQLAGAVKAEKKDEAFKAYVNDLKKSYSVNKNENAIAKLGSEVADKGKSDVKTDKAGQTPSPAGDKK